ncbi:hypothetical protein [Dyadobacter psychrophilus]|uniref:Uncharacterized protein n=1 Tax=Dyadobacter psychrophilus TaxID=651661 RepID=A0A1T5HC36_9BACT|nr:hypothetical protein [Dyadobacter psychrophilus]SKC18140.1 hypothetical protein SAMN05660293_05266 [Dyadobacter psychrophilus]
MKVDIKVPNASSSIFRTHKSYSAEEIIAAGGAAKFGEKTKNNNERIIQALQNGPDVEPFTDEEWEDLMRQLEATK